MWREAVAAQVAAPPLRSVDRRSSAQQHLEDRCVIVSCYHGFFLIQFVKHKEEEQILSRRRRPSAQQHLDSFAVPLFGNKTVNTDEILMNTVNTDEYTDEILIKYILVVGATARRSLCDAG